MDADAEPPTWSRIVSTGFCILFLLGAPRPHDCTCEAAKLSSRWCHACEIGYVAGIPIKSEFLYEVLDPHGHNIDPERIQCPSCKLAMKQDGYCRRCAMGFVRGQAYMSRLTYHLAKGTPIVPDKIGCATCRKNAEAYGWCRACRLGMVGHVAIVNLSDYQFAVRAFETLQAALHKMKECEKCAAAMIAGGYCPTCKISYRDKQNVEDDADGEKDEAVKRSRGSQRPKQSSNSPRKSINSDSNPAISEASML